MRPLVVVGALLILLGGVILVRGLSVITNREVVEVGPIEISAEEKKAVPPWVGGLAAAAGVALIFVGAGKKRR